MRTLTFSQSVCLPSSLQLLSSNFNINTSHTFHGAVSLLPCDLQTQGGRLEGGRVFTVESVDQKEIEAPRPPTHRCLWRACGHRCSCLSLFSVADHTILTHRLAYFQLILP